MKNSFLLFSSLIIILSICELFGTTIYPSNTIVGLKIDNNGNRTYVSDGDLYNIGTAVYVNYSMTDRTEYKFNLTGIPSNCIINNVYLTYTISNGPFNVNITENSNTSDLATLYNRLGQSNQLFSNIGYGTSSVSSSSLTSLVNNNKGGYIFLDAFSTAESEIGSSAIVALGLIVDYTLLPSFTIDNNFQASDGSDGKVIINGAQQSAPYHFNNMNQGTNISLQAVSPQTDNLGYQRIWNTSGVQNSLSSWEQYNGSYNFKTNSSQYNFTVSASDNATTYIAESMKSCNITVQNSLDIGGNGGSIKVNGNTVSSPSSGYQVVEQNPIAVQALDQTSNGKQYYFHN